MAAMLEVYLIRLSDLHVMTLAVITGSFAAISGGVQCSAGRGAARPDWIETDR